MANPAAVAATAAGGAAAHQGSQAFLVSQLADPLSVAWTTFDPTDPNTLQRFILVIQALIQHFGKMSSTAAASFYERERKASGIPGSFTVQLVPPADLDKIEAGIRWATSDLWRPEPDLAAIQTKVRGVVEKDVLDTGRTTIIDAVKSDRKAIGWARVPEPGACSFCALLATRGMSYRSEKTASFEAHDHCRCHVEPVFTSYEPSAQVREWQQMYAEATKGVHGPAAMRRAFRQKFEGREPTEPTPDSSGKNPDGTTAKTPEWIRGQIKIIEGALSPPGSKARAAQDKRLAYLRSLL